VDPLGQPRGGSFGEKVGGYNGQAQMRKLKTCFEKKKTADERRQNEKLNRDPRNGENDLKNQEGSPAYPKLKIFTQTIRFGQGNSGAKIPIIGGVSAI